MGLDILTDVHNKQAVIINDSRLPPIPLPVVFSVYDASYTHDENIEDLVTEFIEWCKPTDVREIDSLGVLRKEWDRFLKERKDQYDY